LAIPHRPQSLASLCFALFKGSVHHRPRLHPKAEGTWVLRAADKTTFGSISRADIALVATNADAAISTKQIVYSEETGKLFFNTNGSAGGFGSGGYFATLQGAPSIAVSDIVI
jgi:hypothetical protein